MSETQPEPQPTEPIPTEPEPEPQPETPEEGESNPPAEGDIPEEPAQAEPETEPPQPEGLSQAEWEARFTKSEKAWDTYAKRIGAIWEEDSTSLIPLTISPSAPPGFLSPADAGRIPDEVKLPLLDFLGITQPIDYEDSDVYQRCPTCKGKGRLKTGSLVAGHESNICPTCSETGFITGGGATAASTPPLAAVAASGNGGETQAPVADVDKWGIPRLLNSGMPNPNYGKTPEYWDHQYPVGIVG
jgi:hypothetical protein